MYGHEQLLSPAEHCSVVLCSVGLLFSTFPLDVQIGWRGYLLQGFRTWRSGVPEVLGWVSRTPVTLCMYLLSPQDGTAPLWIASQMGHSEVVRVMLLRGADRDAARNVSRQHAPALTWLKCGP